MAVPQWLEILETVGPTVLALTPLAPIAPAVVAAIGEAQQIAGATGADKLAHVQNIVNETVAAVNAQAGHTELDPQLVSDASAKAIGTVVSVVKTIHAAHAEDVAEAAAKATPPAHH